MKNLPFLFLLFLLLPGSLFGQNQALEYFIDQGLRGSPLLHEKQNELRSLGLDSAIATAMYQPQITFKTDATYSPVIHGYGYDNAITNGQVLSALLSLDQSIPLGKQFKAQMTSLRFQRDSAQNTLSISQKELRRSIVAQFLTAYGTQVQWHYDTELLALLNREEGILQNLTRNAIYRQTDYLTFLANVKKQQLAADQASMQYRSDLAQLRFLCGIDDTSLVMLEQPQLLMKNLPGPDSSIHFLQYRYDSLTVASQYELLAMQYVPKLTIHADAGYISSFTLTPYRNFGIGAGVSLSIPVYDGSQQELKKEQIQLRQENLTHQRSFFEKQYHQFIYRTTQQIDALKKQEEEIAEQLTLNENLIQANSTLLDKGQVDIPQYFIAVQNYLDLKYQQNLHRINQWMLINEINFWAE